MIARLRVACLQGLGDQVRDDARRLRLSSPQAAKLRDHVAIDSLPGEPFRLAARDLLPLRLYPAGLDDNDIDAEPGDLVPQRVGIAFEREFRGVVPATKRQRELAADR